ncbi:MAG: DUF479 domain-containing protein [Planctomycetes bacterium]|nr:DUF479 domain-containing protein [Planctomycetota bacterium]
MNWLAHLRLAPAAPLLRLGNLCGDFVRGFDLASLHADLRRGIAQHRAVDAFVDAHPGVRRSRDRLPPPWRRFAGVLVDVFHDHFLARDWDRLGIGGPLPAFAAAVHADLRAHRDLLPPRLQQALPWLEAEQWLVGYAGLQGIDTVLRRMSRRSPRAAPLAEGAALLEVHYTALESDFAALWPELVAFARRLEVA